MNITYLEDADIYMTFQVCNFSGLKITGKKKPIKKKADVLHIWKMQVFNRIDEFRWSHLTLSSYETP